MNAKLSALFILLASGPVYAAQSYSHCEKLITEGLREYSITNSSEVSLHRVLDDYCDQSGTTKSSSTGLRLESVVNYIPFKFKGDHSSAEQGMRNFCKAYASDAQKFSTSYNYESKIVDKAFGTFASCLDLTNRGISITHNKVTPDALSMFLQINPGNKLVIRGMRTSKNVKCEGQLQDSAKVVTYRLNSRVETTDSLGVSCVRSPRNEKTPSGSKQVYDEGFVQVLTQYENYDIFLPKTERFAEDTAAVLDGKNGLLRSQMEESRQMVKELENRKLRVVKRSSVGNHNAPMSTAELGQFPVCVLSHTNEGGTDGSSCTLREANSTWTLEATRAECQAVCLE